jgi:hypothetical protein
MVLGLPVDWAAHLVFLDLLERLHPLDQPEEVVEGQDPVLLVDLEALEEMVTTEEVVGEQDSV